MITDYKNGILSFEQENEQEKIFCIVGTIKGDGENFARFITEKEIDKEGWYVPEQWSKDINNLEIGDSSTHGFWYYDKANVIIRVA